MKHEPEHSRFYTALITILVRVANGSFHMARRAFEEESGLYDPGFLLEGGIDDASEQPLEGLSAPRVILFETSKALAAALAAGVFLCALFQWTGVR
jgi:hypothetical protein